MSLILGARLLREIIAACSSSRTGSPGLGAAERDLVAGRAKPGFRG
jgi:hypothetical protein